jgi:DNA-binding LytR/AlgR family response regulator
MNCPSKIPITSYWSREAQSINMSAYHSTRFYTSKHVEEAIGNRTEFLRINRSEMISFNHVKQVDGYQILMNNGKRFTVSRSYKDKFDEFLRSRLPGPIR